MTTETIYWNDNEIEVHFDYHPFCKGSVENGQKVGETPYNWYNWNNREWGVKWDVAVSDDDKYPNTELLEYKSEGEDNWLVYKYETAWSSFM